MCDSSDHAHGGGADAVMPRAVEGDAVDPIALEPVDEVTITTLVDNSYDGLMGDMGPARRAPMARTKRVPAPQFLQGETVGGLVAEHGFAALVTTRRGTTSHTLLFDTGVSPNGMVENMRRLGISPGEIEAIVLSHGHWDHVTGMEGVASALGRRNLPVLIHPEFWSRRRIRFPADYRPSHFPAA